MRILLSFLVFLPTVVANGDSLGILASPEDSFKVYGDLKNAIVAPDIVRALRLKNRGLTEIPADVGKMINLEYLDLSGNHLVLSPADIKVLHFLKHLKYLRLYNNRVSAISKDFVESLASLEALDLGNNNISKLPENFSQFSHLENLLLNGNRFTNLPHAILGLTNLRMFFFPGNAIPSLDCDLTKMERLEAACFANCRIKKVNLFLPKTIRVVLLNENEIQTLQINATDCPRLKLLDLRGNPAVRIPNELRNMISKGTIKVDSK